MGSRDLRNGNCSRNSCEAKPFKQFTISATQIVGSPSKVNVVRHNFHFVDRQFQLFGLQAQQRFQANIHGLDQDRTSIFGAPHNVALQTEYGARIFGLPPGHGWMPVYARQEPNSTDRKVG